MLPFGDHAGFEPLGVATYHYLNGLKLQIEQLVAVCSIFNFKSLQLFY
ncbi:unnamed protein product [Arabidopsis thaliana]|uniref:(thale cress) hypothetical protein n=1 Tax=Arabidopsis thaliana TaxID=3702 RepID=A0A7G2EDA8_ARATH|nr:unnamed protein product [Arabidopsis thaliana]